MNHGILNYDDVVMLLESQNKLEDASLLLYERWSKNRNNISCAVCAGLEIWYTLLSIEYYTHAPTHNKRCQHINHDQMYDMLWEIALFGEQHFSEDPNYNAYFGYMYNVMPYFFHGYNGDYDGWRARGQSMMRRSGELDPQNLFAKAMSHEMDDDPKMYQDACCELWAKVSSTQWGLSKVERYFFSILNGDKYSLKVK